MVSFKLFVPQEKIDSWMSMGSVDFDTKTLRSTDGGVSVEGESAVLFLRVDGGTGDPHALVGKVKTVAHLEAMGADHYRDSVIVGETAYGVAEGFMGVATPASAGAAVEGEATVAPVADPAAHAPAAPEPIAHEPAAPPEAASTPGPEAGAKASSKPDAEKKKAEKTEKSAKADKGLKDGVDVDELARLLIEKL